MIEFTYLSMNELILVLTFGTVLASGFDSKNNLLTKRQKHMTIDIDMSHVEQ